MKSEKNLNIWLYVENESENTGIWIIFEPKCNFMSCSVDKLRAPNYSLASILWSLRLGLRVLSFLRAALRFAVVTLSWCLSIRSL